MRGAQLSDAQRNYAMGQLDAGVKTKEVAETLRCQQRTIQKLKLHCNNTNNASATTRTGRPPVLNRRDFRRLSRIVKKYQKIEYRALMKEAGLWDEEKSKGKVCAATIRHAIEEEGLRHWRAKRTPRITKKTAGLRLKLVERWSNFSWETTPVILTDECMVRRGDGHNPAWVWGLPGRKWDHDMVDEALTGKQPGRMVWAAIWMKEGGGVGRSDLIIMTRDTSRNRHGFTAWSYIKALREGLKPSWSRGEYFMQDNAPIHTAIETLDYLETRDLHVIEWPPYSPDLNPIEHMWLALKRKLHELHPEFDTMGTSDEEWQAFEAGLKEAWAAIPDTLIEKLILSMPKRLTACKAAKGYQTKY